MSIQNKGYTWIANSILKKQFLSNGCTLNSHFNLIPSLLLKKELNNAYLGNLSFSRKYNSSTISKNRIFTESKSFIFEAGIYYIYSFIILNKIFLLNTKKSFFNNLL